MMHVRWLVIAGLCLAILDPMSRPGSFAGQGQSDADQVLAALNLGTQAFVKKDLKALADVLHGDFVLGHASGTLQPREDVLKDVANPQRVWESWILADPDVRVYGTMAVVRCISDVKNGAPGKAVRNYTRALWVLLKGPQGWQIVTAQRVRIEPPAS